MKLPRRTRAEIDPRDEAIGWLAREDEGRLTPDQRAQLRAWLDADPARADQPVPSTATATAAAAAAIQAGRRGRWPRAASAALRISIICGCAE